MIERVQIKNFRSLADVDVELGPITVLVGKNGAGKSAFLDALRFVRDALQMGLESAIAIRGGIASLRRWAPAEECDIEISLSVREADFWGEYSFSIGSKKEDGYLIKNESCRAEKNPGFTDEFEFKSGIAKKFYVKSRGKEENYLPLIHLRESFSISQFVLPLASQTPSLLGDVQRLLDGNFYHILPPALRDPQKSSSTENLMETGENLASMLHRGREQSWFPELKNSFSRVIEGVRDIRVSQAGSYLVTELEHADARQKSNGNNASPWFDLSQESDGTLRLLGMLVALYQENPNQGILGLEEPETALHPGALAVLSDVIRETSKRRQVLITTQSPDLISRFRADELRVVERVNGATQIGPISESQRETIEEQLFSAGDLLRIEGLRREPSLTESKDA